MALDDLIDGVIEEVGMSYLTHFFLEILPFDVDAMQQALQALAPAIGPSVSLPAAKHFDAQFGIDIHEYSAPPPAPPVPATPPIPLPTPNIAAVFDVCDYLPLIGTEVYVNRVKSATAGTEALAIHIPVSIPAFVLPDPLPPPVFPGFDNEIFMGSQTVVSGSPFSRLGMPVLECNTMGIIPPIRFKKKPFRIPVTNLPFGLNFSASNVFIGGPATIDMFSMLTKAITLAIDTVKQNSTPSSSKDSSPETTRQAIDSIDPEESLKCNVQESEPVDIRHGSVVVDQRDFDVAGRLPLTWPRRYTSRSCEENGLCGHGWRTPADIRLEIGGNGCASIILPGSAKLFRSLPNQTGEKHAVQEVLDEARLFQAETPRGKELHVKVKGNRLYAFACPENLSLPIEGEKLKLPIERIEDLCGNFWWFKRHNGKLTGIVERSTDTQPGREIKVQEENGRIVQMQLHDPVSRRTHALVYYRYDNRGNLCEAADALGASHTFSYIGDNYLNRHTDRTGLSFYYEYDEEWRAIHAWGDGGLYDYRFIYRKELRETEVINSLGHASLLKFDDNNLPLCKIDPLGGVTSYEYDETGHTIAIVDPAGLRTAFEYDGNGNEIRVTMPDGNSLQTVFDENSNPIRMTNAKGQLWQQQWDERGLLVEQTDPSGATSRYVWDKWGQLSEYFQPDGAQTRLTFDRYGNLATLTNALGNTELFTHDERGCLLRQTDALGQSTIYAYDGKGRVRQTRQPDDTDIFIRYDAEDRPISYIDEKGHSTELEYLGTGHLAALKQADGHNVRYLYDTEEELAGVVDQNGATYHLKRDPLGRIIEEIDYWGQSTHYQYDASGRLQSRTDPLGQIITYQTDKLGRILSKTLPDPEQPGEQIRETFDYDENGMLIGTHNGCRRITRKFDALGRMVEEQQDSFTVTYAYDEMGNCIERTTSAGNRLEQSYDLLGQLSGMTINNGEPIVIERDVLGRTTKEHLAPDLSRQFRYDVRSRLTAQVVLRDETPLFGTGYQYDVSGNLLSRRDSQTSMDEYRYSPIDRLLGHLDPTGKISRFVADAAGNSFPTQIYRSAPSVAQENAGQMPENASWLRSGDYQGHRYYYDAAGNLVRRETLVSTDEGDETDPDVLRLRWDANHRLIESRRGEEITRYGYDAIGRRVFKRNATHTTWFFWDGTTMALLAEVKQENAAADALRERQQKVAPYGLGPGSIRKDTEKLYQQMAREYIYYPQSFHPFALIDKQQQNEGIYYYHTEPNGCPTRLTDSHGTIVWAADFEAWGRLRQLYHSEVDNPIRFQGQYFDIETGLHYNTFRYYDPDSGGFISEDPIRLLGGINLYQYAPNPSGWIDPWGWACMCGQGHPDTPNTEAGWRRIMDDPNLPRSVRGWLKNRFEQMASPRPDGTRLGFKSPPGLELAHYPGFERSLGYDYYHTAPKWRADHIIEHRYWRKRPGGKFGFKIPVSGPRGSGKGK